MHDRRRVTPEEPPPGVDVQAMPRAPAVLPEVPAPPAAAQVPASGVNPTAIDHDRVSAVHEHFLRLQQRVHEDFLGHRRRLLEGLQRAWGQGPAFAPHGTAQGDASATQTEAPIASAEGPLSAMSFSTEVTWEHPLLDAQVVPAGVWLEPIGSVASALGEGARPGTIDCVVAFDGALPEPGDVVATDVHVWGRPAPGAEPPVRFRIASSKREGALVTITGVLSAPDHPLAEARGAGGVHAAALPGDLSFTSKARFSDKDLAAVYDGDLLGCFGKGFERAAPHTRTPPLPGAGLVRLTEVDRLDRAGGPWSIGSLHATAAPDGLDDARPRREERGFLLARVAQGALQGLAFYVMAAGATIERDGWRFEPLQGHTSRLRFYDAPPTSAPLDYDVVVERFEAHGGTFVVVGDVKASAGGRLVFEGRELALRLVPDWPLSSDRGLMADGAAADAAGRPTAVIEGFNIGYRSLLAGALGRPSDASRGPLEPFERGDRQMPRLPGPPYHFITRVSAIEGKNRTMAPGPVATMDYDIPADAWYFDENGNRTMPFCILLEAALQPCGWLSVFVGCPLATNENVHFRNLDGVGFTMSGEVFPDSGTLRTRAKVTSLTRFSGVMLLSYAIECFVGDRRVGHLTAAFGYFSKEALALQVGVKTTDEQRNVLTRESALLVDLAARPDRYCAGALRLPGPMLLMIDRVTGFWPTAGAAGKGQLRAEKDVDPREWFFKSHFYTDPVQPGSLGLEMMLQLLQFYVIEQKLADSIPQPYFEPLALDVPFSWKYRGQVLVESQRIVADVEIASVDLRPDSVTVTANGWLWVDGVRCYEAQGIGVRVRGGRPSRARRPSVEDAVLDPAVDQWVTDHRPNCTLPVMPGMSMLDRLAGAALAHVTDAYPPIDPAPPWRVVECYDFRIHSWLVCNAPKRLRTEVRLLGAKAVHRTDEVRASAALYEVTAESPAPRLVAKGRVRLARRYAAPPVAWPRLADAVPAPSPYESGGISWGPRLQLLRRLAIGSRGATAELDAAGADAPIGTLHHILLDGALHAIPHEELERWSDKIPAGRIGAPLRLVARFYGPPPEQGIMRAEIRLVGFDGANAFPTFGIQIIDGHGRVWASLRYVEVLIPSHPRIPREQRMPFLLHRRFCEGTGLSEFHPDRTVLHAADVNLMDGMRGAVADVYGLDPGAPPDHRLVAIKDHVGQRLRVHPRAVQVTPGCTEGRWEDQRVFVSVEQHGGDVVVRDAPAPV